MKKSGSWIEIQCFKHDGSLHRKWDRGLVIRNDENFIIVASRRAKVVESTGRKWFTKEPAVTIFSKKHWYNCICMMKDIGVTYYVNLASPSLEEGSKIKYIDYDLDLKLLPDDKIIYLDGAEYEHHKKNYGYSDELDEVLKYTQEKLVDLMKRRVFPFDNEEIKQIYHEYEEYMTMITLKHEEEKS